MIKKLACLLVVISTLVLWTSCRKDFETSPSTGNLIFSRDTVYLDTVFTNIGSSTYNLKVYNTSNDDIHIPTVGLSQGENSYYRLNIDGIAGKTFQDVEIPAKDSIFVFVETTVDITDLSATALEFLYTDSIEFDAGSNQQDVELVTLIKDAVFLYPEILPDGSTETLDLGQDANGDTIVIDGFFLDPTELNWTNEKPYVIYGYAAIAGGDELIIDPGARIHFHANSGIIATSTGKLTVNGALSTDQELLENEVIFEGDRLEPSFSDIPGQWGAIWLTDGDQSAPITAHSIAYATIKNAAVGIILDGDPTTPNTLSINNSQIYNSANFGIRARTAGISAENTIINNSGINSLAIELGGTYTFNHCTLANYWTNSFRNDPTVYLSNALDLGGGNTVTSPLNQADFINCIIYGNENVELLINVNTNDTFNYSITNSLVRFNPNAQFPLDDYTSLLDNSSENVFNLDPNFRAATANDLIIGDESAANGIGDSSIFGTDILGETRNNPPDAGAYKHIIFDD